LKIFVLLTVVFSFLFCPGFSQEKEIREDVTVTNVEVPVRVFLKGKPVKGLKQSDFTLFEGGKKQEINGFYEVSKTIRRENMELSSERAEQYKPRYFVLVFRVTSITEELMKSLDYLFGNIFRKEDQLLVFMNNKTFFVKRVTDGKRIRSLVLQKLRDEARRASFEFEKYFQKVAASLNRSRLESQLGRDHVSGMLAKEVIVFLRDYMRIWREYKKKYLLPDLDNYYNFARFLENIRLEKWVISFYQFDKFPALKLSGKFRRHLRQLIGRLQASGVSELNASSQIISRMIGTIDKELKFTDDFPSDEISRLFLKVNTTFHSLFFSNKSGVNSQDIAFKEIFTDLENSLRSLTRMTGGELVVSNKLGISLEKVVDTEDCYYMITYSPENPKKKEKIKVSLSNKDYKILYDNNIRADYIEDYLKRKESEVSFIAIEKGSFEKKQLGFRIAGITHRKTEGKVTGRVRVHLLVKGIAGQKIYDKSRDLTTKRKEIDLNIGMNWLKPGEYDLTIDVTDILSGRSAFEYLKIKVK